MTITPLHPEYSPQDDQESQSDITAYPPLDIEDALPHCMICNTDFGNAPLFHNLRVCPNCRFHYNIGAGSRIQALTDTDSFTETNKWIESIDPLVFSPQISYSVRLQKDQTRTGLLDAAITGTARIGGVPCAIIAIDLGFLGGSMGLVVGEKVARSFELAARDKLPVVVIATSGGARIQEGILSLTQMAKTIVAAQKLRDKRLPLIAILANPSSGQILASFAAAADIRIGEPNAYIGFAPLGVLREIERDPQIAQNDYAHQLLRKGHIDRVIDRERVRDEVASILQILTCEIKPTRTTQSDFLDSPPVRTNAWESVQAARRHDRPSAKTYIQHTFRNFIELHGDRISDDDPSVITGLAYLGAQRVMIIAQERTNPSDQPRDRNEPADADTPDSESRYDEATSSSADLPEHEERGGTTVPGFRKARRAATFAQRFKLPLIVMIDSPGPALGIEQEMSGMPGEIAQTIDLMLRLEAHVIAVLIGEGGGEAALAFGIADRLMMLEHAIYTPISPEAGAETELRDRSRAPEIARSLRLTSYDALQLGIVDRVIPEPKGAAHEDPIETAHTLRKVLIAELNALLKRHRRTLARRRRNKFRNIGEYGPQFRAAITREIQTFRSSLQSRVRRVFSNSSETPLEDQETE